MRAVIGTSIDTSRKARNRRVRAGGRTASGRLVLDTLEARRLLSVTVAASGKTATYGDVDGDTVTFAITVGTLTAGDFTTIAPVNDLGDQLEVVNLTAPTFAGTNITVTVKKGPIGDGVTNIGYINASGNDLGTVSIAGDLGRIDCGDSTTATPGLKSLTVRSMGRLSLDSQGGSGSLGSHIIGALGALTVKGDIQSAFIGAEGGANGTIGTVSVGGSLIGSSSDHSGEIFATGNIGTVKIAGDIQGGSGIEAGAINSTGGGITSVTVGGSIFGGSGLDSGFIGASGLIKAVTVAGDVRGRTGDFSGTIDSSGGSVGNITIGGSLLGGAGAQSGELFAETNVGAVKIAQTIAGSSGGLSGSIEAVDGAITSVTVGGSLLGSSGTESGFIFSGLAMGTVAIKHDIAGSDGGNSGEVNCGGVLTLNVGGSIIGSAGSNSGSVFCVDTLTLSVTGDVTGGSGGGSGSIVGFASIKSVTIGGGLDAGSNANSGFIRADTTLGTVKIGGDVRGGLIFAAGGGITSVAVAGSVVGGQFSRSGAIVAENDIGTVSIGHSLIGAGNLGTASLSQTGCIIAEFGRIGTINIGGSIVAGAQGGTGAVIQSGAIAAHNDIGSLTVKGNLTGVENGTASSFVMITARGQAVQGATTDVAIGKLSIGGRVQYADILAGYDTDLSAVNADAQIGTVAVGGDWIGSNLVAGAQNTAGPLIFGNVNDSLINSTSNNPAISAVIASVTIKGFVYGTPANVNSTDHFGFVAQQITAMSIAGIKLPVHTGVGNDNFPIPGNTDDVKLDEI